MTALSICHSEHILQSSKVKLIPQPSSNSQMFQACMQILHVLTVAIKGNLRFFSPLKYSIFLTTEETTSEKQNENCVCCRSGGRDC
uniref:Uncharacterized protein n=1 Tax=Arundo donax TaxID=35708 RepID=A0A0A9D0I6_ARUDO